MMCRTFTHHVDGKIRVECVAHPRWHEDAEKTGEHSARAVAHTISAEHEAEDPSSSVCLAGPACPRRQHPDACRPSCGFAP